VTEDQKKTPKAKRRATPSQAKAGTRNLLKFRPARPALKSGVGSVIANGEVPDGIPGGEEIERQVGELIDGLVADLGGVDAVTNAQRVILSGLRLGLLVQALSEAYIKRAGIVDRNTKKPHSLLTIAATYINSARLSALALGLGRVARKAGPNSFSEYVELIGNKAVEPPGGEQP
jgi:hypothetical protein